MYFLNFFKNPSASRTSKAALPRNRHKSDLIFATWNKSSKFYPGRIVQICAESPSPPPPPEKLSVHFYHNSQQLDVYKDDVIQPKNNLMMVRVSFLLRGRVQTGIIYGNDSPKHRGRIKTFFIRVSKREMASVPVKHVFLTRNQACACRMLPSHHMSKNKRNPS